MARPKTTDSTAKTEAQAEPKAAQETNIPETADTTSTRKVAKYTMIDGWKYKVLAYFE